MKTSAEYTRRWRLRYAAESNHQILDAILLTFADEFEAGNQYGRPIITPASVEEFEVLRECLAAQVADG